MPQRPASEIIVYVNGAADPLYRCLHAVWSAGGKKLDHATLFFDLPKANENLNNFRLGEAPVEVEIQVIPWTGTGNSAPYVIHWGKTSISTARLDDESEKLLITSRTEPFHFGGILTGMYCYDPLSTSVQLVQDDLVFNPEVDGRALPNCGDVTRPIFGVDNFVFLDPESARTGNAKALSGVPIYWNLASIAFHLCWLLNPFETNFANPALFDLETLLGTDPDLVFDLKLRRGLSLPEALDHLLEPFGFGWFVSYLGIGQRAIALFERGTGLQVQVAQGLVLASENDAAALEVEYNVGNTRNWIEVQGDHVYIESTFVLSRGWPSSEDILNPTTDLAKDSDNYQNNPSYQRAWRDWVLNEAGDYTLTRPEILTAFDLTPIYAAATGDINNTVVPKRRKFFPTITQGADLAPIGEVHGTVVEYSLDSGETWQPVDRLTDSTVHLLERECGVRFDGQHIPIEIYYAGSKAQVRITASIKFDQRITADFFDTAGGPQTDLAPILVDAHEKFHFKQVAPSISAGLVGSKFYPQIVSGVLTADQADDRPGLADFCQELLAAWNMADVSAQIEIQGLDNLSFTYALSDVVTGVNGRNIDFNAMSVVSTLKRYPQIASIEFFCQGDEQKRILHLETYRDESSATLG